MKSIIDYINEVRELDPKSLMAEGRIQTMSDNDWLNQLYCNSNSKFSMYNKIYIEKCYGAVQNFALYGISTDIVNEWKEQLAKNKGITRFRTVKAIDKSFSIIYFKYNKDKDQIRKEAEDKEASEEKAAADRFASAVRNADTSKYVATTADITKMKGYYNKRSNPERLVKSIKDDTKLVSRWIAAIKINWPEAVSIFGSAIVDRHILTKAKLTAYKNKYSQESERVDDSDIKRLDDKTKKVANSWITKTVFRWFETLKDVDIEWLETFTDARTSEGKSAMSRNGRAWTEGFVVKVTKGTSSKNIIFDIVTNEGGGLYGYVLSSIPTIITLKEFKKEFLQIINSL